jgi:ribosome recycling factor
MLNEISGEAKDQMERAIDALKKQLSTIRAGRANVAMLEGIRVDYYGNPSPLNQVASVTVADARLLMVKPWEKQLLKDIEKAIVEANIGIQPNNDGEVIRLPIPALSEERRKEYVKQAKTRCEDAKIAVRNARRDANEMLKDATKEGEISEDDEKRGLKTIQDLTDQYVARVDELLAKKEGEIMEV